MQTRILSGLLMAAALVLSLSACETLGLSSKPKNSDAVDLACPPVETPAALTTMSKTGTSPLDTVISGNLHVTGTDCKIEKDTVTLKIDVELVATRGPALKDEKAALPFFAAAVDQSGNLLNKKLYETTFSFGSDITDREKITLEFAMPKSQAPATRVYVGYQWSRDAWLASGSANDSRP